MGDWPASTPDYIAPASYAAALRGHEIYHAIISAGGLPYYTVGALDAGEATGTQEKEVNEWHCSAYTRAKCGGIYR